MNDIAFERITVGLDKLGGEPCIRGMRISVARLVRLIRAGWTLAKIQDEFPLIEPEDIQQAVGYAELSADADSPKAVRIDGRGVGERDHLGAGSSWVTGEILLGDTED